MGSGKSLAGLALIFGLVGVGLGGYTFYSQIIVPIMNPPPDPYVPSTWYDQNLAFVDALPSAERANITDLNVIINVKTGEGVNFYYNGVADLFGDLAYMGFAIGIDGTRIVDSSISVYLTGEGFENYQIPVSIIYSSNTITQGIHNITILFSGSNESQSVLRNRLLVQTYKI
jgi:hypothetical protein